jgi:hypothetical protein
VTEVVVVRRPNVYPENRPEEMNDIRERHAEREKALADVATPPPEPAER